MFLKILNVVALIFLGLVAYTMLYRPFLFRTPQITMTAIATPQAAQTHIQTSEGKFTDVRAGASKEIVWFEKEYQKTEYAIVYIHGFSASKEELRPVPDDLANTFKANLFYTRLAGHGRPAEEMGKVEIEQWLNDTVEAVSVGRAIGNKVIVIGTSTGASLLTWLVGQPKLSNDIAAAIFVSPNFGIRAVANDILRIPFARQIVPALLGKTRRFTPVSQEHEYWWTPVYPTEALIPMAMAIDLARAAPIERVKIPVFVVYSTDDKVVDGKKTKQFMAKWGGPIETHIVNTKDNPGNHVPAGRVMSPSTTGHVTKHMTQWLEKTLNR